METAGDSETYKIVRLYVFLFGVVSTSNLTQKPNSILFNIKAYIKINRCIAKVSKVY
jgi:hypothetical protein